MILVIGGTFGAALIGGTPQGRGLSRSPRCQKPARQPPVDRAGRRDDGRVADRARHEGLLALEGAAKDLEDDFQGRACGVPSTAPTPMTCAGSWRTASPPSAVLENLDNPEQLGHMIAVAFVGTLWGPLLPANTTCLPFAARVKRHPSSSAPT